VKGSSEPAETRAAGRDAGKAAAKVAGRGVDRAVVAEVDKLHDLMMVDGESLRYQKTRWSSRFSVSSKTR